MVFEKGMSIILPAFNEEEIIEEMILHTDDAIKKLKIPYEIIVVNDGSIDNTLKILKNMKKTVTRLNIISFPKNRGYADALKEGFEAAKFDLIFYTDSDMQFDVNEVKYLLEKSENFDIVCGFRAPRKDPLLRLVISFFYNRLIDIIFNLDMKDIDCAFKLFRKEIFYNIEIESKGFLVDLEIMAKAKRLGFEIAECPVSHYPRKKGISTVSMKKIVQTLTGIFKLRTRIN